MWPFKKKPKTTCCSNCNKAFYYEEEDTIAATNRDYRFVICPNCSHAVILPSEEEKKNVRVSTTI